VLCAAFASGLTIGLMSIDMMELEIKQRVGTPSEQHYARRLLPILTRRHLLLVTLLLFNASAAEALPLFLSACVWVGSFINVDRSIDRIDSVGKREIDQINQETDRPGGGPQFPPLPLNSQLTTRHTLSLSQRRTHMHTCRYCDIDELVPEYVAVIISVTMVLFFGEIFPSAIFSGKVQLCVFFNIYSWVK
jgi:hypothetical protein